MDIRIDNDGPFPVARLVGEFGAGDVESFMETLQDPACSGGAALAIDLSGVKSIDSSGLSAMIGLVTRSRLTEGRVVLVGASSFVSGILNVTRLDQWFEMYESLEEATRRVAER